MTGEFIAIGRAVETVLIRLKGKPIPMNIDGSTAVIFSELGFEPEMGRGTLHTVSVRWDPRSCVGTEGARRADQGPDAEVDSLYLHRSEEAFA